MTEMEARKIRSAYSNGFQFPFGGGFLEKCDMDEVNRTAELLDDQETNTAGTHKGRLPSNAAFLAI